MDKNVRHKWICIVTLVTFTQVDHACMHIHVHKEKDKSTACGDVVGGGQIYNTCISLLYVDQVNLEGCQR